MKHTASLTELLKTDPSLYDEKSSYGVTLLERTLQHNWPAGMTVLLGDSSSAEYINRLQQALLLGIRYDQIDAVNVCLDIMDSFAMVDGTTSCSRMNGGTISHRRQLDPQELASQQLKLEECTFDMRISPISLAIVLVRHEIALLLMQRGYCDLHPVSKFGDDACPMKKGECVVCESSPRHLVEASLLLENSHTLVSTYKALCSPIYIFNSDVKDPVIELFKLSANLRRLKMKDPSFSKEYDSLNHQSRLVAVELLDLCRTESEVETLLSAAHDLALYTQADNVRHPGVLLALHFNQKEFIAHPHCQHVMSRAWYDGLPRWLDTNYTATWKVTLTASVLAILLPILCILYIFHVSPTLNKTMRIPAVRFVTDTVSYCTFILLILALVILKTGEGETHLGDHPSPISWCIFIFLVGMVGRTAKALIRERGFQAFKQGGYRYDLIFFSVFIAAYAFLFIQLLLVSTGAHKNIPRHEWPAVNLRLVSEALQSVACIMACIRFWFLFEFNQSLGTLTISLRRMMGHIIRFLFVFSIVISAFGVALTGLYLPYSDPSESMGMEEQASMFNGFHDTFKTLFWAVFGFGDANDPDLVNNRTYTNFSSHQMTNTTITCILLALSRDTLTCVIRNASGQLDYVDNAKAYVTCQLDPSNPLNCTSGDNSYKSIACYAGDLAMINDSVSAHLPMRCECLWKGYQMVEGEHHRLTEVVGYVLYGFYNVLAVIILLNMLIATMANSYTHIEANSDQEWKFARARMLMNYFLRVGTLPTPFNIIGAPLHLLSLALRRQCGKMCACCIHEEASPNDQQYKDENYKKLIRNLHMRYWYRRYKPRIRDNSDDAPRAAYDATWNTLSRAVSGNRDSSMFSFSHHMPSLRRQNATHITQAPE